MPALEMTKMLHQRAAKLNVENPNMLCHMNNLAIMKYLTLFGFKIQQKKGSKDDVYINGVLFL